jgi:hypothetical protein
MTRRQRSRGERMIQWIGVVIALLGLAYNGVKDYQKGDIKIPKLPEKTVLTKPVYPVQYCLMAYDPNIDKVFYLHENGIWYDYAPQQRRYASTPSQHYQAQAQEAVGGSTGTSGTPNRYDVRQPPQAASYPPRY